MSIGFRGLLPKFKRVDAAEGSGTFTVPPGVDHIVVHMRGGGGGIGTSSNGSDGGFCELEFPIYNGGNTLPPSGRTFTFMFSEGGRGVRGSGGAQVAFGGNARSGRGATTARTTNSSPAGDNAAHDASMEVKSAPVTPGEVIQVTVPAGGSKGGGIGASGGSGIIMFEYMGRNTVSGFAQVFLPPPGDN